MPLGRMPPLGGEGMEGSPSEELDEQSLNGKVLDDLEEWIAQKRAELELGPLKKPGTAAPSLPPVGE